MKETTDIFNQPFDYPLMPSMKYNVPDIYVEGSMDIRKEIMDKLAKQIYLNAELQGLLDVIVQQEEYIKKLETELKEDK